jgi:hypothetical protein
VASIIANFVSVINPVLSPSFHPAIML